MAYLYFKGGQVNAARDHIGQVMKFETQASTDPAVQRAVERSRDMLAQINATGDPIAQAAPQATVATASPLGGASLGGKSVQQTSQSGFMPSGVSPAGSFAPVVPSLNQSNVLPPSPSQAAPLFPGPSASTPNASGVLAPTRPMPSMPSASTNPVPTNPAPTNPAPTSGTTAPSVPFALPSGFGTN
jgi:hypothetical protein